MIRSRWTAGWPSLETEQSHHISCLLLEVCGLLFPGLKLTSLLIALSLCFVSSCQFLPLSSFSHLAPSLILLLLSPPLVAFLSWGLRGNAPVQEGILHNMRPGCGCAGAIYKWLLINPRPTLMLSHFYSSPPSRTFACIWMFGQTYADGCEWKAMKIPRLCQQQAVT